MRSTKDECASTLITRRIWRPMLPNARCRPKTRKCETTHERLLASARNLCCGGGTLMAGIVTLRRAQLAGSPHHRDGVAWRHLLRLRRGFGEDSDPHP